MAQSAKPFIHDCNDDAGGASAHFLNDCNERRSIFIIHYGRRDNATTPGAHSR